MKDILNKTLIDLHTESIFLLFQDYWNNNLGGQSATTARKTEEKLWLQRGNEIMLTQGRDETLLERKEAD